MATRKLKFVFWFCALALILACVPTIGTPIPTVDPNQINIFIAQTANAAASQTAAVLPTFTQTETTTPTPEDTTTPSLTATSTVIFILSTPTKSVTPTLTGLAGGTTGITGDNFACQVLSVTPPNGTSLDPRTDFDAVWQVRNIGKKQWDRNAVDYVYASGAELYKTTNYDLPSDVKSGATVNIIVDMIAPKKPGSYTTNWVLRNSSRVICNLSLTINVK